jgi:hypothetical protein
MKAKLCLAAGLMTKIALNAQPIFGGSFVVAPGPIWSSAHAQTVCPTACQQANGKWDGGWWTTVPGLMSECACVSTRPSYSHALDPKGWEGDEGASIITQSEWLAIQRYVANARTLPDTEAALRSNLGLSADDSFSDFKNLLEVNRSIREHSKAWEDTIFPMTLNVARDIQSYAATVPDRYGELKCLAKILAKQPQNEAARAKFLQILEAISQDLAGYIDRVDQTVKGLKFFADVSAKDEYKLKYLFEYYDPLLKTDKQEAEAAAHKIQEAHELLESLHREYEHDVTVAATTPTYAWIWPIGTIAAGTTATIYGKKAADVLEHIRKVEAEISALEKTEQTAFHLAGVLNKAVNNVSQIDNHILGMLVVLQRIRGNWAILKGDVDDIGKIILEEFPGSEAGISQELMIEDSIAKWESVEREASQYLSTAKIEIF